MQKSKQYIQFLGTGCGDYFVARNRKPSVATRFPTQLLLPEMCLIDFSPTSFIQLKKYHISIESINDLLITHSQVDHFHAPTIVRFALIKKNHFGTSLRVWGTEMIHYLLEQEILLSNAESALSIRTLTPLKEFSIDGLDIIPIPAQHLKQGNYTFLGEIALNFIISIHSKKILYAVDTGYPSREIFEIWKKYRFDHVIIEATHGDSELDPLLEHLNFNKAVEIIHLLRENGNLPEMGSAFLIHLSPFHIISEERASHYLARKGIKLASEGLKVKLSV